MRSSTAAGTEPTGWEAGSGISSVTGPRVSPAQGGSGGRKPSVFLPLRYQYRTTDPDRSRRPVTGPALHGLPVFKRRRIGRREKDIVTFLELKRGNSRSVWVSRET